MHRIKQGALVALTAVTLALPAQAGWRDTYEVYGVHGEDMLKLRMGPGVGYNVIVGLPNGTEVLVKSCERIGNTRWCKVALKAAQGLTGYASDSYLRKK
ncbi:SH3 domain-containing protein [Thioclava sp. BHET1]|uniref:Peptide-binding protein n=1 Tax=Thioclava dalianensis TaxID=1185766 RepID=A0A074TP18_9RHOB|nr:SH3 domain-containing protein [Thioclava dalianensis]KEP70723.1 peptide-binding protein [Thioclava dalianensis]TMV88715.1 SH3 domain-containing protein [Thioclava sp. BHET1]SFN09188.1 SH3 domain-containing protein [Thioclava dalianensis]